MSKIFTAKSIDGKLSLGSETNKALFEEDIKQNPNAVYKIQRVIPERTLNQNKLYWAYLQHCEYETGNNANDLHELFKRTLLPPKWITVMGKEIKIPKSTTELTKIEFGDYLDKISMETGIALPTQEEIENYTNYMI